MSNKDKISESFMSVKNEAMEDLNFIIEKIGNIIDIDSLTSREQGFYCTTSFSLYSSIYEKFSCKILLQFKDILIKMNGKKNIDYLIAYEHRNQISGEKNLNDCHIIEVFKEKLENKEKMIANSFVSSNKGLDNIKFISHFIKFDEISEADLRTYISTNFTFKEGRALEFITNFAMLEDRLESNYKNRNDAVHGQFKTIEAFSFLLNEAFLSLLALKLYIKIISDKFIEFIHSKDL